MSNSSFDELWQLFKMTILHLIHTLVTFPAPGNLHSFSPWDARAESVGWLQSYSSFHIWKKSEVFPVLQNLTHMRGEEIFHWQINISLQGESIWMKSLGAYQRCPMRRRIKFRTTSAPEWCLQSIHVFARTLFTSTYLPGLCTFFFRKEKSFGDLCKKGYVEVSNQATSKFLWK